VKARFRYERLYCLHCPVAPEAEGFTDAAAIRTHLCDVHDVPRAKAEIGQDWAQGLQAQRIHARRVAEAEPVARRAARYLVQPVYTVEDFLTDAGDEPWPALDGEA